jgi:hypothetical protein
MKIDKDILNELRNHDDIYRDITEEDLMEGYRLSIAAKEYDNPDDEMDYEDLFKLSSFYAYEAMIHSNIIDYEKDDFEFDDDEEYKDYSDYGGDSFDSGYYQNEDDYY